MRTTTLLRCLLAPLFIFCQYHSASASNAYQKGAQLYLDSNFEPAITELAKIPKSDTDIGKVHYYLGLCYMRLKERDKAAEHFQWMQDNSKDPQMLLLAYTWLGRIDRHKNHISDNYSIGKPQLAKEHGTVSKVMWFYTNWCPKCKRFRQHFEEAETQFKDLKFEKLNSEDPKNWTLVSKYKVRSYPTLVYFDNNGRIIENYAAAPMGDTFKMHLLSLGATLK